MTRGEELEDAVTADEAGTPGNENYAHEPSSSIRHSVEVPTIIIDDPLYVTMVESEKDDTPGST
jgi:hypothetical protein